MRPLPVSLERISPAIRFQRAPADAPGYVCRKQGAEALPLMCPGQALPGARKKDMDRSRKTFTSIYHHL